MSDTPSDQLSDQTDWGDLSVIVDMRPIDHPTARQRGIGRYVTGLLHGLAEIGAPVIALSTSATEVDVLREVVPDLDIRRWAPRTVAELVTPSSWYLATQLMLHPIPMDPIPSMITESGMPVAALMYDVIPYRFPERYQSDPNGYRQAQLRAPLARTCDAMLAISEFSASTAAKQLRFPRDRIVTIGAGVEPRFRPEPDRRAANRPGATQRPYVVSVTGGDPRKNTDGLIRAWARMPASLRSSHQLVVVAALDTSTRTQWEAVAAEAGVLLHSELVLTGAVTDEEMVGLLQQAELAVMPSFEEGFGLPILEAAACGVPVISSNLSSLPEVLDEPAAFFDPVDPTAIAAAMAKALTDDDHRSLLLVAGRSAVSKWTWRNSATATMHALGSFSPRWRRRIRPPARRVAVAGPFEGSSSGIGSYNVDVRTAWRRRCPEVSWQSLVDNSGSTDPVRGDAMSPVRGLGRFEQLWHFDDVIATLGSSPHHVATVHRLAGADAHMWLHEASLVGVHVGLAHRAGRSGLASSSWNESDLGRHLSSSERRTVETGELDLFDAPALDRAGVTMVQSTIVGARSIIVSSPLAAQRVADVLGDHPPMLVLPLAHRQIAPTRSGDDGRHIEDSPEIVVVGWLAPEKLPDVTIEALSLVREGSGVVPTLRFIGPVVDGMETAIAEACLRFDVADRVVVDGALDGDRYHAALGRAAVAVQLRAVERGEQSAAITDLLAAGVPVITNMASHAPGSSGLRLVDAEPGSVAAEIDALIGDPIEWRTAAADARERASAWSFDDVADALSRWLDDVPDLSSGTVRIAVRPR